METIAIIAMAVVFLGVLVYGAWVLSHWLTLGWVVGLSVLAVLLALLGWMVLNFKSAEEVILLLAMISSVLSSGVVVRSYFRIRVLIDKVGELWMKFMWWFPCCHCWRFCWWCCGEPLITKISIERLFLLFFDVPIIVGYVDLIFSAHTDWPTQCSRSWPTSIHAQNNW